MDSPYLPDLDFSGVSDPACNSLALWGEVDLWGMGGNDATHLDDL